SAYLFAGIGLGTPFLGWLSNYAKNRKGVLHISMCIGTVFMLAALYLPHFPTPSLSPAKFVAFGVGFFLSGSMLVYTCAGELLPNSLRGMAIGIINMFVFIGSTLISSLPYVMVTSTEIYTKLWVMPVLLVISIMMIYFVKETYRSEK
ncbi:MAG: MFS transporter, partial [Planctomycetales bacterium]